MQSGVSSPCLEIHLSSNESSIASFWVFQPVLFTFSFGPRAQIISYHINSCHFSHYSNSAIIFLYTSFGIAPASLAVDNSSSPSIISLAWPFYHFNPAPLLSSNKHRNTRFIALSPSLRERSNPRIHKRLNTKLMILDLILIFLSKSLDLVLLRW